MEEFESPQSRTNGSSWYLSSRYRDYISIFKKKFQINVSEKIILNLLKDSNKKVRSGYKEVKISGVDLEPVLGGKTKLSWKQAMAKVEKIASDPKSKRPPLYQLSGPPSKINFKSKDSYSN